MGNVLSKFRDSQRPKEKRPSNTLSAYLERALQGYWDRQGHMANEGLQMADQGAKAVRGGDFSGLAGAFLGPMAYLGSPVSALFPERSEVEAATDVPNWSKPLIAGGLETMAIMAPGPKGKGLGKGLVQLADDATDAERAALAGRLQTEATQTGGQAVTTSRDQALRNLTEAPEGIVAYHGSPHTFDKFDISKIGTGEGAQAYGHGLYFAENEGVARSYRDTLQGRIPAGGPYPADSAHTAAAKAFFDSGYDEVRTLAGLKAAYPDAKEQDLLIAIQAARPGSLYQVRINAKPEEFLDWDRPLSEQPKAVRKVLEDYQGKHDDPSVVTAGDIARDRSGNGSDIYFADDLKKAGVKGIRYKDAGSRSGEGGTYNYVVFDDKIIDILKRYGIPMTAGVGGAMVVTGENMPPDIAAQMGPQA